MRAALSAQKNEITEYRVYSSLAKSTKDKHNSAVLDKIAKDELRHYNIFKGITGRDVGPRRLWAAFFIFVSRIFGLTFGVKWLENREKGAQKGYAELGKSIKGLDKIIGDEEGHEKGLINMISEERLEYAGSIVLGLNDALVELTGTLAGVSFAFQNNSLIALSGLVMGIAAALSMAASAYLSKRADGEANAGKSSLYTGVAYIITVAVLVSPFFIFSTYLPSIALTLTFAILEIMLFTFYISVAKDYNFKKRFAEMAGISLGVAGLSFVVGLLVKSALGVSV
jgi:VIT1/CCC1 family predicted Fe2+/Mn2+ transporter